MKTLSYAQKARDYFGQHPDAKVREVVVAIPGIKAQAVYEARAKVLGKTCKVPVKSMVRHAKRKNVSACVTLPKQEPVDMVVMSMHVPKDGIVLKMIVQQGCVGTLFIGREGVSFAKAKAKVAPGNELKYNVFEGLLASGLIK